MNKIPFTSQNPYAFYAKNIDGYDTETNTRKAKKNKKKRRKNHS
jgi:RecB family exonuclease